VVHNRPVHHAGDPEDKHLGAGKSQRLNGSACAGPLGPAQFLPYGS
jgi:hypothetical protein